MNVVSKRIGIAVLVIVGLLAGTAFLRGCLRARARRTRETGYQSVLASYSSALKPAMTRKQVEDYLRARNPHYLQMCCVDANELAQRSSWDDLVKIGSEAPPFYCGENNVYIALQFIDHKPRVAFTMQADELDTLRSVTIYRWLENCL